MATTDEGVTFYKGGYDGGPLDNENSGSKNSDIPISFGDFGNPNPELNNRGPKTTDFQSVDTQDGTPSTSFDSLKPTLWQKHDIPGPTNDVLVSPVDKLGDAFPKGYPDQIRS